MRILRDDGKVTDIGHRPHLLRTTVSHIYAGPRPVRECLWLLDLHHV